MSTPPSSEAIQITIPQEQQSLRLLEVPSELLDSILRSSDPPKLYFKASDSKHLGKPCPPSGPATKNTPGHLHLCSPTQSYEVRQVSTSNSVYVLAPPPARDSPAVHDDDDCRPSIPSLAAVAHIDTMLELLPVQLDSRKMLMQALPVYDIADDAISEEKAVSSFEAQSAQASRLTIFGDIPAPDSQLDSAWRSIQAFELNGRCAKAGPMISLNVWKAMIDFCACHRLDLAKGLDVEHFSRSDYITSPVATEVAKAVLAYLSDSTITYSRASSVHVNRESAVSWTGTMLIQATSQPAGVLGKGEFLSRWKDLLPEAWRGEAVLEKLPVNSYHVVADASGRNGILWGGQRPHGETPALAKDRPPATVAAKRDWHEKFKLQRKEMKK